MIPKCFLLHPIPSSQCWQAATLWNSPESLTLCASCLHPAWFSFLFFSFLFLNRTQLLDLCFCVLQMINILMISTHNSSLFWKWHLSGLLSQCFSNCALCKFNPSSAEHNSFASFYTEYKLFGLLTAPVLNLSWYLLLTSEYPLRAHMKYWSKGHSCVM